MGLKNLKMNFTKFAKSFIEYRPWIGGLIQFENFYIEVCRDYTVFGWKYQTTRMEVTDSDEHSSLLGCRINYDHRMFYRTGPVDVF